MEDTKTIKVTVVFDKENLEFHFDSLSTTMRQVQHLIFNKYGVPVDEQILYDYKGPYSTPKLNKEHSLAHLKVHTDGLKLLMVVKNIQTSIDVKVQVPFHSNEPLQFYGLNKVCTIRQLKFKISDGVRIAPEQLELDDEGRVLNDELNFFQSNLYRDRCTINCSLKESFVKHWHSYDHINVDDIDFSNVENQD